MIEDYIIVSRISFSDGVKALHGKIFVDFSIEYSTGETGIFNVWLPIQHGTPMFGLLRYTDSQGWVPNHLMNAMVERLRPMIQDIQGGEDLLKGGANVFQT